MASNTSGSGSMFVELSREKDDSVTLYFRVKDRRGDGVAFFCIARHDYAGEGSLFQQLVADPQRLKVIAVQSDAFFHTGHFACGFCTVKNSVGRTTVRNIVPNTPYQVAISVSFADSPAAMPADAAPAATAAPSSSWQRPASDPGASPSSNKATAASRGNRHHHLRKAIPAPFQDEVQLRELKEKPQKLVAIYHLSGMSPWNGVLLPSMNAVQLMAHKYYNFLRRITHNPHVDISIPLTIRGVMDPLCGLYVALTQTCGDDARRCGGVRNEVPSGVLFEALAALGSASPMPSLKGPWVVDWLDFLLIASCETKMFPRLQQLILQYKAFELEGQTLRARINWMVRPEAAKIPPGTLVDFMHEHCPGGAAGFTPGRAVWALMPHRQQVRALRYMFPSRVIEAAVEEARVRALSASDPDRVLRLVNLVHIGNRFDTWMCFIEWRRRVKQILIEKRTRARDMIEAVAQAQRASDKLILQVRFRDWRFFTRSLWIKKLLLPKSNAAIISRAFDRWSMFIKPAYRFPLVSVEMLPEPRVSILLVPGAMTATLGWQPSAPLGPDGCPIHPCYMGAKVITRMGRWSAVADVLSLPSVPSSSGQPMPLQPHRSQRAIAHLTRHAAAKAFRDERRARRDARQAVPVQGGLSPQQKLAFELLKVTQFRLTFSAFRLWRGYERSIKVTREKHDEKALILSMLLSAMKGNQRQYAFRQWKRWAAERSRELHARSIRSRQSDAGTSSWGSYSTRN